jgi:hypothetical protein
MHFKLQEITIEIFTSKNHTAVSVSKDFVTTDDRKGTRRNRL